MLCKATEVGVLVRMFSAATPIFFLLSALSRISVDGMVWVICRISRGGLVMGCNIVFFLRLLVE